MLARWAGSASLNVLAGRLFPLAAVGNPNSLSPLMEIVQRCFSVSIRSCNTPGSPQNSPVPCPSPNLRDQAFPAKFLNLGGAGPGKRAGRRRRRIAKTPSTQSYPVSSHVQLISEVQATILNRIRLGTMVVAKLPRGVLHMHLISATTGC